MLRAMSAAGLVLFLAAAWAVGLPAAENEKSEAAAKAAEAFESLFGKEYKQVRMTADVRDDIDLAKRLLAAAAEAKDQPDFVTVLCEKACELASVPAGYATAAEALQLLASTVPEKSAACVARLIEIRQRQYDAAKGEDRAKAGETLLDALLAAADTKEKAGDPAGAATHLKRALLVATAVKSDRRTEIETHLKALELSAKTLREIEDLKKQLEADPQKVTAREKLVRLLLVDRDDPAEAAKWVEGIEDAALKKYVPAAAKSLAEAPEIACLELGEWYRGLGESAPPAARPAMYARAQAYYDRFLETHTAADLDRTKAKAALQKIEAEVGKLPAAVTTPAPAKEPKEANWIDLLPLVDPTKDAVRGNCQRKGTALVIESRPGQENQIKIPVIPQGDYELQFKFTRSDPTGAYMVSVMIPVGESSVLLDLGAGGADAEAHLLENIKGKGIDGNETLMRPGKIEDGVEHSVSVKVETDQTGARISVVLDGRPIINWRGPPTDLSVHPAWGLPNHRGPALMTKSCSAVWHSVRLRMLSGDAKLLRPGDKPSVPAKTVSPEKPEPKEKPVKEKPAKEKTGKDKEPKWLDVLAYVDPAKDKVEGMWVRQDTALALVEPSPEALIMIPVAPKGSYEFQARFERTSGDDTIAIVLPVGQRAVSVLLNFWGGVAHGLADIKGEDPKVNETRVRPAHLENNRDHTVCCKVVGTGTLAEITVTLDDQSIINWRGPTADLSVFGSFALPKPECLGLGVSKSKLVWKSAELRMLSGDVKPMRPLAKPPAK